MDKRKIIIIGLLIIVLLMIGVLITWDDKEIIESSGSNTNIINNQDIIEEPESINEIDNQGEKDSTNKVEDSKVTTDQSVKNSNESNIEEKSIDGVSESSFTEQIITTSDMTLQYWLYIPKNAAVNMPLIVYLHGGSGKGNDLNKVVEDGFPKYIKDGLISDIPSYIIIPQLPSNKKGWISVKNSLYELINNTINTYSIDRSKISLTGHSMGGTGTYELALAYPELFSCIVPMSGSIKNTDRNRNVLANIPIWVFVGSEDTIVEPTSSITFINDLKSINNQANITIIDGASHFDVPNAYLDSTYNVITWMLLQKN